jgi:hypothetical protein
MEGKNFPSPAAAAPTKSSASLIIYSYLVSTFVLLISLLFISLRNFLIYCMIYFTCYHILFKKNII